MKIIKSLDQKIREWKVNILCGNCHSDLELSFNDLSCYCTEWDSKLIVDFSCCNCNKNRRQYVGEYKYQEWIALSKAWQNVTQGKPYR